MNEAPWEELAIIKTSIVRLLFFQTLSSKLHTFSFFFFYIICLDLEGRLNKGAGRYPLTPALTCVHINEMPLAGSKLSAHLCH